MKDIDKPTKNAIVYVDSNLLYITEHVKANEEKFKKMKDVYGKLRDEHVTLLRQVSYISHLQRSTYTWRSLLYIACL